MQDSPTRIVVLGAGPAGLGAARRLVELGHADWDLYERGESAGGLASSVTDAAGYTWDLGCHVQHSHYPEFDRLMEELLGEEYGEHRRESWVRFGEGFVPYPFQRNVHLLPEPVRSRCLEGLERASGPAATPENFREWILASFGETVAEVFMFPYNLKAWGFPPEELSVGWLGDRVAAPDLERLRRFVREGRPDPNWGPNARFRYPRRGGAGEPWCRLAARLPPGRIHLGAEMVTVDGASRRLRFADGSETTYDALISTVPLDVLLGRQDDASLARRAGELRYSAVHVFGVGLSGTLPEVLRGKSWIYFPDEAQPFHRATVFSNYAPGNLPEGHEGWTLMLEVSESEHRPVDATGLEETVLDGLVSGGLVEDRGRVEHVWSRRLERGYPTPFLGRDALLDEVLPALEERGIYSRGRFGAWKYEVSNQDHSYMQGVEVVDRLLRGEPERTLPDPAAVNAGPISS